MTFWTTMAMIGLVCINLVTMIWTADRREYWLVIRLRALSMLTAAVALATCAYGSAVMAGYMDRLAWAGVFGAIVAMASSLYWRGREKAA